jgi:hypothetical protein
MPPARSFETPAAADRPGGGARFSPLVWCAGFLIAGPVLADQLSLLLRTGGWQAVAAQLGLLGSGPS